MTEATRSLLAKLDELEARFEQLERQISDPAIVGDSARVVALSKEKGKLKSLVSKYRQYKAALSGIEDTERMANDETLDEDFRALAREELQQLESKNNALLEELQDTLLMADEINIGAVIMEVRAGTGGDEAALFGE